MSKATLTLPDYAVIAITLLISSAIGIYYRMSGGRQKTVEEYFVANKSMSVAPVAFGLLASFLSAISVLGVSAENYTFGTHYAIINIAYILGTPVAAYLYMPVFFKLGATSSFEIYRLLFAQYLERRFGKVTRTLGNLAFLMQLVLYTGVVLYAPCLALEATTKISREASVTVLGLVCTFYSTIGGIKAVLATVVFQAFLMFASVIIVIITASADHYGITGIWEIAENGSRIDFFNFSLDPTTRHTWWSLLIGGFITFLSLNGVNQVQVQRMLSVKDIKTAQKALWWSLPMSVLMSLAVCFSGLAIYAKYHDCDPYTAGRISSNDQLMPLYVMETLSRYPGIPGLFVAGIFSAGLSTISSTVNSIASVIFEDYLKPLCHKGGIEFSESRSALAGKIVTLFVGLSCMGVAFLASQLGAVLQAALVILGVVGGPLLGLYTLGMFTESANQRGALSGLLVGLAFSFFLGFGQPKPTPLKLDVSVAGCNATTILRKTREIHDDSSYFYLLRISYMWYSSLGFLTTLVTGYIVSFFSQLYTREENCDLDINMFSPIMASRIQKRRDDNKSLSDKQNEVEIPFL